MMIKINLLPIEELEDNVWWVKPTIICTVIAVVFLILANFYLNHLKQEISSLEKNSEELTQQIQENTLQVQEYDGIQSDIDKINSRVSSLEKITSSKLAKYRPLIIIELLQSLKPENMWFSNIELDVSSNSNQSSDKYNSTSFLSLSGSCLDPESVSKFMENLERTKDTLFDSLDLRTQLYFKSVVLTKLNTTHQSKQDIANFALKIEYADKANIKR